MTLVLIVDDSDQNRKLARDLLRAAGLQTLEAATGADGIALAAERRPDVILMDLRLPDMAGTAAARVLGEGGATARIPIVALSALRGAADPTLPAGFAGYLDKPLDVTRFAGQVLSFCAGRESGHM